MLYVYLKSYNIDLLNHFCKNILFRSALNVKGPIFLPKKIFLYTVIRSPHVYSLSREQFEVCTFRRVFIFKNQFNFLKGSSNLLYLKAVYKALLKSVPVSISLKLSFKDY
jgi:ribosomal protein S10